MCVYMYVYMNTQTLRNYDKATQHNTRPETTFSLFLSDLLYMCSGRDYMYIHVYYIHILMYVCDSTRVYLSDCSDCGGSG